MKKFLLGTVALAVLGMAAPASAADLAARPYTKAPPMMAAIYDWSGFYIGVNGGYGSDRSRWTNSVTGAALGSHDADGATAGGQVGYRWQSGQWVYGLEAQGNWADFRGSHPDLATAAQTDRSRIRAFGLFTGQVGYAWNNALLYVKGGAAVTDNRYAVATPLLASALTNTRVGSTIGGGLEFGFAPNWSAAVEYNHLFTESRNVTFTAPAATDRIRSDADLVTAKINYRWGGPVVARY